MSAEGFEIIAVAGYGVAILCLLGAVIWFFLMDIPSVLGELSGRTAEREVRRIREQNRRPVSPQRPLERTDRIREAASRQAEPVISRQEKPAAPRQSEPAAPRQEKPAAPRQSEPASPRQEKLAASRQAQPAFMEETTLLAPKQQERMTVLQDEMFIHTDEVIV